MAMEPSSGDRTGEKNHTCAGEGIGLTVGKRGGSGYRDIGYRIPREADGTGNGERTALAASEGGTTGSEEAGEPTTNGFPAGDPNGCGRVDGGSRREADERVGGGSRREANERTDSGSRVRAGRSLPAWLQVIRPLNAVMAGVGVVAGAIVAAGTDIAGLGVALRVLLAYLAAFCATGAGNALNDIVDADTDRSNHPERPIPSGRLTPDRARRVVYLGFGMTLLLAASINHLNLIIAILNISLMAGYELRLKKQGFVGNITISYLTGSVFIFGGSATLTEGSIVEMAASEEFGVTLILAFLAFLVSAGREIIKDIQDMAGDTDRFTLPMRIGRKRAGLLAACMILGAVALSWIPYHLGIMGPVYLILVLPADALFVHAALTGVRNPASAQRIAKFAMLTALMAFLAGAIL